MSKEKRGTTQYSQTSRNKKEQMNQKQTKRNLE